MQSLWQNWPHVGCRARDAGAGDSWFEPPLPLHLISDFLKSGMLYLLDSKSNVDMGVFCNFIVLDFRVAR